MMMKALLLICAVSTPQADCSVDTAAAVIQGPDAPGLAQCGLYGQAYIAEGALAGYFADGHYLKIACTSRQVPPAAPVQRLARQRLAPPN